MNLLDVLGGFVIYAVVIDEPIASVPVEAQTFPVFMTMIFVLIGLGVLLLIGLAMRKK